MQILITLASLIIIANAGIVAVPSSSLSVVNSHRSGDSFSYSTYQGTGMYPGQYQGTGVHPGQYQGTGVHPGHYQGTGVYQGQYPVYQQYIPQYQQAPVLTSIYQGGAIYQMIPGIQFAAPGAAPVGVIGAGGYPVGIGPIYGNPAIAGGPVFGQPVQPQETQVPVGAPAPADPQPELPITPPALTPVASPGVPAGPPPIIPDGPVTDDNDTIAIESA